MWGHVSPGGGFAGGSIIGTGLSLYCIAYGFDVTDRFLNRRVFLGVLISALCFYLLAKGWSFVMSANGLKTGIPLGTPGNLFSAGLILPLNIAVGAVVSMTIYGLFSAFKRGRI